MDWDVVQSLALLLSRQRRVVTITSSTRALLNASFSQVPLATIVNLTASVSDVSTVAVVWELDKDYMRFLHGQFRTFAVVLYENYSKNDENEAFQYANAPCSQTCPL